MSPCALNAKTVTSIWRLSLRGAMGGLQHTSLQPSPSLPLSLFKGKSIPSAPSLSNKRRD